jgi:hypothetical protein
MKVFVGFGYNDRDQWIETQVFPILLGMGFTVVDGGDVHGQILQPAVETLIDQSDAAIGFFTIRDGQGDADFTSHIWVRDEMVYANAKGKPLIPIQEEGVKVPAGSDRASRFRLETGGWGVFPIVARVQLKAGTEIRLSHALALHYPDGTQTSA